MSHEPANPHDAPQPASHASNANGGSSLMTTFAHRFAPHRAGLLLCLCLGIASKWIGGALPLLGSGTCAILVGILVGNLIPLHATYRPGIRFCESKVLEFAVACMGFSLSLQLLNQLGWMAALGVVVAVVTALTAAFILTRLSEFPKTTLLLIGVGTAICGSSAIAAAAPLIAKDRKDIGISVGVVSLLGVVGIFVLPAWTKLLGFDLPTTGLLIGATLQSVPHVVAAGFSVNDDVGNIAITVKMGRVAMLIPLVLYLTMTQRESAPSQKKVKIPWYLSAFLIAAAITSIGVIPEAALDAIKTADKLLLTIAMAAIGLSIHFKSLREQASQALLYGGIIWVIQIGLVSLIAAL